MDLELVTIGDELLLGFTLDSNSAWLSRQLSEMGVRVVRRTTVPDAGPLIVEAVRDSLRRTGAVITTGGLGPTTDDLTTASVAAAFDVPLVRDESVAASLVERWQARIRSGPPTEAYMRQALVPQGATVLHNSAGSAPGLMVQDGESRWVAVLPGVPREMKAIFNEELRQMVAARTGSEPLVVRSRTLRTVGVAESVVSEWLHDADTELGGLPLSYLPSALGLDLRLTTPAVPARHADTLLDAGIAWLRARVGANAYGLDGDDLAGVVLDRCRVRGVTLAVAESCTGGLLGARLTSIAGSSDVFLGGVISYSNDAKRNQLGVASESLSRWGAVSEQVALEMAAGARERFSADIAVAITGIAGPAGGSDSKPVGTVWTAVDSAYQRLARVNRYGGDRDEIRVRAAQGALDAIRLLLT